LSGFRQHKQAAGTPAPLTSAEEELAELRRTEVNVGVGIDSRHQTLSGVAFPMTDSAWKAIEALAAQNYNYIQLRIGNYLQIVSTSELGFKSWLLTLYVQRTDCVTYISKDGHNNCIFMQLL